MKLALLESTVKQIGNCSEETYDVVEFGGFCWGGYWCGLDAYRCTLDGYPLTLDVFRTALDACRFALGGYRFILDANRSALGVFRFTLRLDRGSLGAFRRSLGAWEKISRVGEGFFPVESRKPGGLLNRSLALTGGIVLALEGWI